jgi:hypothetical protein
VRLFLNSSTTPFFEHKGLSDRACNQEASIPWHLPEDGGWRSRIIPRCASSMMMPAYVHPYRALKSEGLWSDVLSRCTAGEGWKVRFTIIHEGCILKARSSKFGCGAMHRFDDFMWRVIRWCSGFERLLKFI